jgi:hypothetical protein
MNTEVEQPRKGEFDIMLKLSNKQIRADRAEGLYESAEMRYGRAMEDIGMEIKELRRKRANMLDLSPTNADSLMLGEDFNAADMVKRDLEIGLKMRELEIKQEILTERYNFLFKGEVKNG